MAIKKGLLIRKYFRGKWYVRIDGNLAAGFHSEEYADLFIKALENVNPRN